MVAVAELKQRLEAAKHHPDPAERNTMNQKEIKELIEFLVEKDIAEFELQRGDMKLLIKRGASCPSRGRWRRSRQPWRRDTPSRWQPRHRLLRHPHTSHYRHRRIGERSQLRTPSTAAGGGGPVHPEVADCRHLLRSSSPGAPPFVKVGDAVKEGQVLCIIEAMKLMNEIEADVSGVIAKMFVPNGSPVEYGMPLFGIRRQ